MRRGCGGDGDDDEVVRGVEAWWLARGGGSEEMGRWSAVAAGGGKGKTARGREAFQSLSDFEDEEVSLVDGVLEGALGALGDEIGSLGDGVFVSSWVKSTNNCFGGMMLSFGLLETLEMEALVEAINVYGCFL
ncbi:hypothetical protein Tco_1081884 [Tanacetum coccineum]|uniref:Uncharacterized protein n=1 Tax=Tanacetum coccineum TaxID=301880 RepID=A0ABQ5HYX6_9ASTR